MLRKMWNDWEEGRRNWLQVLKVKARLHIRDSLTAHTPSFCSSKPEISSYLSVLASSILFSRNSIPCGGYSCNQKSKSSRLSKSGEPCRASSNMKSLKNSAYLSRSSKWLDSSGAANKQSVQLMLIIKPCSWRNRQLNKLWEKRLSKSGMHRQNSNKWDKTVKDIHTR